MPTHLRRAALAATSCALAVGAGLAFAGPASASVDPDSFAGYTASPGSVAEHTVTGTLTVPTFTCPHLAPNLTSTLDLGVSWRKSDGYTVIRADVQVVCMGTAAPTYSMLAIVGSSRKATSVTPGDVVTLQATWSSTGTAAIARNTTTGITLRANSQPRLPVPAYAQVGIESLDDRAFAHTPVQLRGLTVDGTALGSANPTRHDQQALGKTLLVAGPLTGRIFYVRFVGRA